VFAKIEPHLNKIKEKIKLVYKINKKSSKIKYKQNILRQISFKKRLAKLII
jgi:hypothetical protein